MDKVYIKNMESLWMGLREAVGMVWNEMHLTLNSLLTTLIRITLELIWSLDMQQRFTSCAFRHKSHAKRIYYIGQIHSSKSENFHSLYQIADRKS